jgi:hypothetical protein
VLARLDRIPGVYESLVEPGGRHFVLELKPGADFDGVRAETRAVLGTEAVELDAPENYRQLEGFSHGELWMNSFQTITLSLIEARVLAARYAGADARLADALYHELAKEFTRLHAEGGTTDGSWWRRRFPEAFERAVDGLGLPRDRRDAVLAALVKAL